MQHIETPDLQSQFLSSHRKHILMITNHGIHEWNVVPGLPDTGGQNVFVNQFTESLAKYGYRITIVNRGGYKHPDTGELHTGFQYKDKNQRILYIEDKKKTFIRKEDMHEQIPELTFFLYDRLENEDCPVNLIISHYWDGAEIGVQLNHMLPVKVPHIWVPHSLGTLKKMNVKPEKWELLRIEERINAELELVNELDGIAATSSQIKTTLAEDYGYSTPDLFLPPCVDTQRIYPRLIDESDPVWDFLNQKSVLTSKRIRSCKIISEISRTDSTKRKNILIQAFTLAHNQFPDSVLIVSIDDKQQPLAQELQDLIISSSAASHIIVVGSIWDILPKVYAVTDIYCTPSVMEGFGMSAQEAAATRVPVISSNLVPYVREYLLGSTEKKLQSEIPTEPIMIGDGAIVVQADDIQSFSEALKLLLHDDKLREEMGDFAYNATIPYFTWNNMVKRFLEELGLSNP